MLLMLVGCQASPPPAAPGTAMETLTEVPAWRAPTEAEVWTVDAAASEIRVLVYRAGALARLGHNHVITGAIEGEIHRGARTETSGFRLRIPLDALQVDLPAARADEGQRFAAPISDNARAGTRTNLLGPAVLDAAEFPEIRIESLALEGPRWNPRVTARLLLRGEWHQLSFPAAVVEQGQRMVIVATLRLSQAALGMAPFSALGGSLQVADELDVRLRIVAAPQRD
jgi:polyisoprenoid-binding protein YceI